MVLGAPGGPGPPPACSGLQRQPAGPLPGRHESNPPTQTNTVGHNQTSQEALGHRLQRMSLEKQTAVAAGKVDSLRIREGKAAGGGGEGGVRCQRRPVWEPEATCGCWTRDSGLEMCCERKLHTGLQSLV